MFLQSLKGFKENSCERIIIFLIFCEILSIQENKEPICRDAGLGQDTVARFVCLADKQASLKRSGHKLAEITS